LSEKKLKVFVLIGLSNKEFIKPLKNLNLLI
jgi:hypothetical protein